MKSLIILSGDFLLVLRKEDHSDSAGRNPEEYEPDPAFQR